MRAISAGWPGTAGFQEISPRDQAELKAANPFSTPAITETDPAPGRCAEADPLLTSLARLKLNCCTAADRSVLYTKDRATSSAAAAAPKQAGVNVPTEVAAILAEGAKNPDAKREFTAAQQALAAGDYSKAHDAMESLMRKQGEDVLTDEQVKSALTVRDQLGFLSDLQKAGIKADYPPTEAQLVAYFKTLKDKPGAARQAFEDYTSSFHIHPANVRGAAADIQYSHTKVKRGQSEYTTDVPHEWADVSTRPAKGSDYAGRQMNDCQGYAYLAEKLLSAAGFKTTQHVVALQSAERGHAMVVLTHPKESGFTLSSNDKTYHGNNAKALVRQGYEGVVGEGHLTGKEHYYTGKTQSDAEIECAIKDHEL